MAAQQQQHQMLAAAQINQAATFQAAQLQAQIQAQARAASFQSLQQAAQMQSSAQNAAVAAAAMAASAALDQQLSEQISKSDSDQIAMSAMSDEAKLSMVEYQMATENHTPSTIEATNLITSSTTELNHFDESAVNTTVINEPLLEATFNTENNNESDAIINDVSSSSAVKQQAPRIIYNSPAVMASIVTSPVSKP